MNNKCSSCGFELKGNVSFCPKCGSKVEAINVNSSNDNNSNGNKKFCLYCGSQIDASAKFCPKCGANFETGASGSQSNSNGSQVYNQGTTVNDSSVTTAFIFSLIGLLCCAVFAIPGLIKANECLSEIEMGRISQSKKGMATAAKVISLISLILWALGIITSISRGGISS